MKTESRKFQIPRRDWKPWLERFTQKHLGLQVELETYDRETDERVTTSAASLDSVKLDLEEPKNPRINVTVLAGNKEIRHILFRPSQVILHASRRNGDEALTIDSLNIETTVHLSRARRAAFLNRVA